MLNEFTHKEFTVWDLPLRLFHWLLVVTILLSYLSAKAGGDWADWHARLGGFALALVIFRLLWGLAGSHTSRFVHFFPSPTRLNQYIRGKWQGVGHNPLGALSVIALLAAVLFISVTGLFANDDITLYGPLYSLLEQSDSDWLTGLHKLLFDGLLILIGLHVIAIGFYWIVKRQNLVRPMLTGKKTVEVSHIPNSALKSNQLFLRFVISIAIAAVIVWSVFSGTLVNLITTDVAPATPPVQHQW